MGAQVIKVEAPTHPDLLRLWAPPGGDVDQLHERNYFFQVANRNKLSLSLMLDTEEGREIFRELVKVSDVVIDNFSARVMANLGFDYESLRRIKEDIIVVTMPAFGASGPYRDYVCHGDALEGMAGLTLLTGYRGDGPRRQGVAYLDPTNAFYATIAVLAALLYKKRTGRGQFIDLSHMEGGARCLGEELVAYQFTGRQPERAGNRAPFYAPQGCYPCQGEDNWIVISVRTDQQWEALTRLMGAEDLAGDESLKTMAGRQANHDRLDERIAQWTRRLDKYAVMEACQRAGIPSSAVLKPGEVVDNPHFQARGFLETVQHPVAGSVRLPRANFRLSKTPARVRAPAPLFGQHTDFVLRELLGKSAEEVARLKEARVVGRPLEFFIQY